MVISYESHYFKALLSNDVIEMRNNQVDFTFDDNAFRELITYIYTGDITLSDENITDLIDMSNYFQVLVPFSYDNINCLI